MKTFGMILFLIGILGGIEDNAHGMMCPLTDNVKVMSRGGYTIQVKYRDCNNQWIESPKIVGLFGQSLSIKVPVGKRVFVHWADGGGDPKPFCSEEVPKDGNLEITTWGTGFNPYCVTEVLPKK